ncbi:MAG: DUF2155 domain-containing protein [Alphaproteobacteria bacterium]|nr:MAG: DUF2155 domain-containing protein [Alphaproteobacteria bacterium]
MVRHRLFLSALLVAALLAAFVGARHAVSPAAAQFGAIFGGPPRPPADIPQGGPPPSDDRYFSSRPQPVWPREPQVVAPPPGYPQQQGYPQQGYPAPQNYPPPPGGYPPQQAGRPPGGFQQQDLPPPPGATAAPPGQPAALPGPPPGQRQPRGAPGETPATPAPPNDEVVIAPPAQKIPNNSAVFSGLDKITGRIISFDVALNETVQFGALQVTPRVCYTRPPTETSNTDAFIEVDEITLQGEIKRIFTGWMFAATPGLHAIEHPIYDIWLADCKAPQQPAVAAAPEAVPSLQPQPQPQRPARPPQQQRAKAPSPPPQTQALPPPPGSGQLPPPPLQIR